MPEAAPQKAGAFALTRIAPSVGTIRVAKSTPLFLSVCAYILFQGYTLPVVTLGWWPTWLTLPDIMSGAVALCAVLWGRRIERRMAMTLPITALTIFIFSYICVTLLLPQLGGFPRPAGKGFGAFQLARMAQFCVLYWAILRLPIDSRRKSIIATVAAVTFLWVVVSVVLTKTQLVPTSEFGSHIPAAAEASGPWFNYLRSSEGLGTIGYNHGYVAFQALTLASLTLSLSQSKAISIVFPPLMVAATLLTGSRAGLAAALLLSAGLTLRLMLASPGRAILFVLVGAGIFAQLFVNDKFSDVMERQATVADPFRRENLSGRTEIWANFIELLAENPAILALGVGFGSAADLGGNAHMMPLHVLLELGIVGLLFLGFVIWHLVSWARRQNRVLFWYVVSVVATLYSQETLYPVVAFGHSLGIFLVCLGIAGRLDAAPGDRIFRRAKRPHGGSGE